MATDSECLGKVHRATKLVEDFQGYLVWPLKDNHHNFYNVVLHPCPFLAARLSFLNSA